jgi:hypothetical protein
MTSSSPLHASIYPPGPGSNRITVAQLREQLGAALTDARVGWRTEPRTTPLAVVAHERTRFVVTVVYGLDLEDQPGPAVEVAWQNEALLTPSDPDAVRVEPQGAVLKSLDAARPRDGGGFELEWDWTITASEVGSTELILVLRPLIFVDGVLSERIAERNEPIEVPVQVHPTEVAFDQAVRAATTELFFDPLPRMTDGGKATIVVHLPRWSARSSRG